MAKIDRNLFYSSFSEGIINLFKVDIDITLLEADEVEIIVTEEIKDKYWLLGVDSYGDPSLWWVVLWFNGKKSLDEVEIGDKLRIMKYSELVKLYNKYKDK